MSTNHHHARVRKGIESKGHHTATVELQAHDTEVVMQVTKSVNSRQLTADFCITRCPQMPRDKSDFMQPGFTKADAPALLQDMVRVCLPPEMADAVFRPGADVHIDVPQVSVKIMFAV